MEKEITIKGKTYKIVEIKYKDIVGLGETNPANAAKTLIMSSAGLTEDEYNDLSMKDGIEIQKVVNEVNGLVDFQKPQSL